MPQSFWQMHKSYLANYLKRYLLIFAANIPVVDSWNVYPSLVPQPMPGATFHLWPLSHNTSVINWDPITKFYNFFTCIGLSEAWLRSYLLKKQSSKVYFFTFLQSKRICSVWAGGGLVSPRAQTEGVGRPPVLCLAPSWPALRPSAFLLTLRVS